MSSLRPGEVRFVHHALPALAVGSYRIEVQQAVERGAVAPEHLQTFERSQRLRVEGPRFGLGADDVHAVYPPANSAGDHTGVLPHVVLRRRGLPWALDIVGDNAARGQQPGPPWPVPWLALLVFRPDDPTPAPPTATGTYAELLGAAASATHRLPALTHVPDSAERDQRRLTVVDIPASTLEAVLPAESDLPWTAHVREVRTDDKELLGLDEDGWFSVVIANRVPGEGVNTVHLVSLEGWRDSLPASSRTVPPASAGDPPCRMVSLASWSFTSADRGTFESKMGELDVGRLVAARPAPERQAGAAAASDADLVARAAQVVTKAVGDGFVPLRYDMRHGETTVAWYRGPLTPVPVPRSGAGGPLPSAEAGLVYHPDLGMFDASYAVAWQIGRLLALADAGFAGALMDWRQRLQGQSDWLDAQEQVRAHHAQMTTLQAIGDLEERVEQWRERDRESAAVMDRARLRLEVDLRELVLMTWDPDGAASAERDRFDAAIRTHLPVLWSPTPGLTPRDQVTRVVDGVAELVLDIWDPDRTDIADPHGPAGRFRGRLAELVDGVLDPLELEAASAADADRAHLADEVRELVLRIWDPDALATAVARHAADGVLTGLLGPVLPAAPDTKARLAGGVA